MRVSELPPGYRLRPVKRASAAACRRRPILEWRLALERLATTPAGRAGAWQTGARFGGGTHEFALAARGAILIAEHRSHPNLYALTGTGLAALEQSNPYHYTQEKTR